jgi:hypothetical protein
MSLLPCPECKAEISSQAHFCPRCGYPFQADLRRIEKKEKAVIVKQRRPIGIFLGVVLCVAGALLLFSRHMWMLPMYFHGFRWPMTWGWEVHRYFGEFWRHIWISPLQVIGLLILIFGIAQLISGSSKLTKQRPIAS